MRHYCIASDSVPGKNGKAEQYSGYQDNKQETADRSTDLRILKLVQYILEFRGVSSCKKSDQSDFAMRPVRAGRVAIDRRPSKLAVLPKCPRYPMPIDPIKHTGNDYAESTLLSLLSPHLVTVSRTSRCSHKVSCLFSRVPFAQRVLVGRCKSMFRLQWVYKGSLGAAFGAEVDFYVPNRPVPVPVHPVQGQRVLFICTIISANITFCFEDCLSCI